MTSLLERIGAFFLEPSGDRDAAPTTEPGSAPRREGPAATTELPRASARATRGFAPPSARRTGVADLAPPPAGRADAADPAPPPAGGADAANSVPPLAGGADAATPAPPPAGGADAANPAPPPAGGADAATPGISATGFAAVLGAPAEAVPVAAACAGELRARARAAAAVLCVWSGGEPPAGATTPAVRRLVARLAAHGLAATASGRLAWVALDPSPAEAATQVMRARALADAPIVLAIAGARPAAFEPLLADAELALVVLPAAAEAPLRALALATLPSRGSRAVPPLPPGPPRWAAMAGLARMRSLEPVPR